MICWFAGPMGLTTCRPSVCCSKYFFFIFFHRLRALKTLYFHFCNFVKNKNWKGFCEEFARFYEKKIILGTSDAWSMSRLSHRASEPAFCIVDGFYDCTVKTSSYVQKYRPYYSFLISISILAMTYVIKQYFLCLQLYCKKVRKISHHF